jgi:succinate dehydrogenase / fumarate reductase, cytochrome b subunit
MTEKTGRPLSPHLQIYRPQLTTVMSITHRFTGSALAVGTLLVIWLLIAAATGPGAYGVVMNFCHSILGKLMLFGWTAALYYHLCNGVRHLIWDTGRLLDLKGAYGAGYIVLFTAVFLTVLTWCLAL